MAGTLEPPDGASVTLVTEEPHAALAATAHSPATPAVPRAVLAPGDRIDRYEILALLGRGGMGTVHRARDTELAREVALKVIDRRGLGLDEARARLRREAQAMARVEHAAVVRIYDVGVADDRLYATMELVDGGTLAHWLETPRTWREIVTMFVGAGRGLIAAHAAGLVHRDFKPANVLVDSSGRPRVTDFGLARTFEDTAVDEAGSGSGDLAGGANLTATGAIAGTPAYMAPEQLRGEPIDARADEFAFCVALWEALYSVRPFRAEGRGASSLVALLDAIVANRIEPPPAAANVPRALEMVVRRGLSAVPDARWGSLERLTTALETVARPPRRKRAAVAIALALCTVLALVWWRWPRSEVGVARPAPAPTASVVLGEGQILDRTAGIERVQQIFLRDGRIARTAGTSITIRPTGSSERLELGSPDGRPIAAIFPGAATSSLLVVTWAGLEAGDPDEERACAWWELPTDGGAANLIERDEDCAMMLAMSPGGDAIAVTRDLDVFIRDRATGAERWTRRFETAVHTPVWSPDGRRIGFSGGLNAVVLDAASGEQLADRESRHSAWLDSDRLLHWNPRMRTRRAELRVSRIGEEGQETLATFSSSGASISASQHGILVELPESHSRAFVIPTASSAPARIERLTPLDTGGLDDFEAVGWTSAGEVVTVGVHADKPALLRTIPGRPGVVLLKTSAENFGYATRSRRTLFYRLATGDRCELRVLQLDDGQDRSWRVYECARPPTLRCAAAVPRCILVEHDADAAQWIDPQTLAGLGPAPMISQTDLISPDGREVFSTDGTTITVRELEGGVRSVVTPEPPLPGEIQPPTISAWGHDASSFLLIVNEEPGSRLVELDRAGHWRVLLESASQDLRFPSPSPDGRSIAVMHYTNQTIWRLLPIVADHGAR